MENSVRFVTLLSILFLYLGKTHQQCPSPIPDESRVDCHPEINASPEACEARGCLWCEAETPGAPWCIYGTAWQIPSAERIDCHPEPNANPGVCSSRGCIWREDFDSESPWCFYPLERGYKMIGNPVETTLGYSVSLEKIEPYTQHGDDVINLAFEVEFQTDDRVRFKFFDPSNQRFEVPMTISAPGGKASNPDYDIIFGTDFAFSFQIIRKSTGTVLFDTSLGGFLFSDQYIQIATRLASSSLFGFGEHEHQTFKHDVDWHEYSMFARDQPPQPYANMYGVHPYYMVVENDFNAHGVLILNSNAQEIDIQPAPSITYRTIGGILDFYLFLGPTPENVVQQYTAAIGRTFMPPYWSLGFQLSRYGYDHIDVLKTTVDRMRTYDIPLDVQFGDIDYMDRFMDFTYDKVNYAGLPEYVDQLKEEGTNYIIILDPCIMMEPPGSYPAYDLGNEMDVWVKAADGTTPVVGKVWPPEEVVFPDYTHPNATKWWVDQCLEFHDVIDYDGLWIDMNEVANFYNGELNGCAANRLDNPPYKTRAWGQTLSDKTICMEHKQFLGYHYDVHNLYGWSEGQPSLEAARTVTGKRSIVISRSTYPGMNSYAGHWLGDNFSNWPNMHYSIIGMLDFNIFGIPYIGADICGFIDDTEYELCLRWHLLGAFYPFSRNHNGYGYMEQDPGFFGEEFADATREVLHVRYTLLPYLYTLFHKAHIDGSTVIRPMMHEFITDLQTQDIHRQFLWGPALLISPVLNKGMTTVSAYFPNARWYDYYTGQEMTARQRFEVLSAPLDYIPLHIRGGYILPTQKPGNSTMFTRTHPMGLIVALDDIEEASGDLFWDDGDSIDTFEGGDYFFEEFIATKDSLTGTIQHSGYMGISTLEWGTIRVFGVPVEVVSVTINGGGHVDFTYDLTTSELTIRNANVAVDADLTVTWL
ncbi:sucrase-isomaltase, intestinal-like [Glandiceps talaboti]